MNKPVGQDNQMGGTMPTMGDATTPMQDPSVGGGTTTPTPMDGGVDTPVVTPPEPVAPATDMPAPVSPTMPGTQPGGDMPQTPSVSEGGDDGGQKPPAPGM